MSLYQIHIGIYTIYYILPSVVFHYVTHQLINLGILQLVQNERSCSRRCRDGDDIVTLLVYLPSIHLSVCYMAHVQTGAFQISGIL